MRRFWLIGLLVVVSLAALLALSVYSKTYVWNEKITYHFVGPEKAFQLSHVYRVRFRLPISDLENASVSVRGEAAVFETVDGYVFSLLPSSTRMSAAVQRSQTSRLKASKFWRSVSLQYEPVEIETSEIRGLVWFADINDPTTAEKVSPEEFALMLGDGFRLTKITAQATDEDITQTSIATLVPWLPDAYDRNLFDRPDQSTGADPFIRSLGYGDFLKN